MHYTFTREPPRDWGHKAAAARTERFGPSG